MSTNQTGESTRQIKIGQEIQKEVSKLFLTNDTFHIRGTIVSVTSVRMTADFALARVNISVFPFANAESVLNLIKKHSSFIRGTVGNNMKNQLRIIPEFKFYLDTSIEDVEHLENLIKM